MMTIDIAMLVTREQPDPRKTERYAALLRAGSPLPPVAVLPYSKAWNGQQRWLLVDGHHRLAAHKAAGCLTIAATLVSMSK
jgi:ParB-like chromosome segregation protein Spo0J